MIMHPEQHKETLCTLNQVSCKQMSGISQIDQGLGMQLNSHVKTHSLELPNLL